MTKSISVHLFELIVVDLLHISSLLDPLPRNEGILEVFFCFYSIKWKHFLYFPDEARAFIQISMSEDIDECCLQLRVDVLPNILKQDL